MHTQRNIMLIVLSVMLVGVAAAAGVIWWLGWVVGALVLLAVVMLLIGLYIGVIRPWHVRWGATDDEVAHVMPGDDLVPKAVVTTRAITIDAEPRDVWPWLVQIGFGMAGWYSYDWIDNDGQPSADRIVPEYQNLQIGDQIEIVPGMGPNVVTIDPAQAIVSAADDRSSGWCLGLYPIEGGGTRLISRWRNNWEVTPATAFIIALTDPGAFIMEQKMLRVIRDRVRQ